jgi:Acetyltransferase (GNAT) domain
MALQRYHTTGISIRPAALDAERKVLVETLARYLNPLSDEQRFDWLYRENPHGQGRAWIACRSDNSTIVGMAAAFPRRIWIRGAESVGWVLGDFCVSDQNRSLGLALQLQRACLAGLDSGGKTVFYDFPSASMMAVYHRLGIESSGRMTRFAKLLRADQKIGGTVRTSWLADRLSKLANSVLSLRDRASKSIPDCVVSLQKGRCGEEFSVLAQKVSSSYGMCVQRSAEYLNWRYLAHPTRQHQILKLENKGDLLAYVVFTQIQTDASIADLFGINDSNLLCALLQRLGNLLRESGVCTLSVPLLDSHPWLRLFRESGFYRRESCAVVLHGPTQGSTRHHANDEPWFLMDGDRES